ncbi:hypothetical protein FZEAL_7250 [Fusarium zealandicum]|uniref:Uncharacterized protein n=1 Tax=Fusarium zealandicum TaxID=1053134 RepID=A0A8H4XI01_9HYPO|nr:hypothetical protein FZEAL_7250 [Fusarium zealandicum]
MPHRQLLAQVHDFWERVRQQRAAGRPRRYADLAAADRRARGQAGGHSSSDGFFRSIGSSANQSRPADPLNPPGLYPPESPPDFPPGNQPGPPASAGRAQVLQGSLIVPGVRVTDPVDDGQALQGASSQPWELPGTDSFPERLVRPMDGSFFERNVPDLEPSIFVLLLETFMTSDGFIGTEEGLNLPLILATLLFALDHKMLREVATLYKTIGRYIAFRMFFHNPHSPYAAPLTRGYFAYRSEEIYRSWSMTRIDPRLYAYINPSNLVVLYVLMVDHEMWSDLSVDFQVEFKDAINQHYEFIGRNPGGQFKDKYGEFFGQTGIGMHAWLQDSVCAGVAAQHREDEEGEEREEEEMDEGSDEVSDLQLPSPMLPLAPFSPPPPPLPERDARRIRREIFVLPAEHIQIDLIEPAV